MNVQVQPPRTRHEAMRIAGKRVDTPERIEVRDPYTNTIVGTVPRGRPEHVRDAFKTGRAFKSKLTRYERQKILLATAEKLAARRDEIAALITSESGLSMKDSLYEAGRAYDRAAKARYYGASTPSAPNSDPTRPSDRPPPTGADSRIRDGRGLWAKLIAWLKTPS